MYFKHNVPERYPDEPAREEMHQTLAGLWILEEGENVENVDIKKIQDKIENNTGVISSILRKSLEKQHPEIYLRFLKNKLIEAKNREINYFFLEKEILMMEEKIKNLSKEPEWEFKELPEKVDFQEIDNEINLPYYARAKESYLLAFSVNAPRTYKLYLEWKKSGKVKN